MHPAVRGEFQRLLAARGAAGAVLEIGARPRADTLLTLPALAGAAERIGLDLDGPHRCPGFEIRRGDANRMDFPAARFDVIVSNSVLEHDPRFWLTLSEIRRVARPGALVVLGVPGYGAGPRWPAPLAPLGRLPLVGAAVQAWLASTPTLLVHEFPGDYYRFSAQAMREVLLAGFVGIEVVRVLRPPRFVGAGRVPAQPASA
jgi:SAM-dependent methyltransferase